MSNYPEGVTGREPQIAGPSHEYWVEYDLACGFDGCPLLDQEQSVQLDVEVYGEVEYGEWECGACGRCNEYEGEVFDRFESDRIGE